MPKERLDVLVVDRGLAPSRERARAMILAGKVAVNDSVLTKAGASVPDDAAIRVVQPDHPYVGRGGVKLAHALDAFGLDPAGRDVLDVGASTGGFTDVLLRRGAVRVIALDVGHGQFDWRLRNDSRVTVMEGVNARTLAPGMLPYSPSLVTIDVSFISLRQILPALPRLLTRPADVVALVKPQFEAGRREVGHKGVVRDPAVHMRVVDEVADAAAAVGLVRLAVAESPITGATGNREYFLHLRLS
jgi:23S rRNA (cytidine1920-2'-O)/16S rRNA (cytidine1409-2'-O)-methyltransferase